MNQKVKAAIFVVFWILSGQIAQAQTALFDGFGLRQMCLSGQCLAETRSTLGDIQSKTNTQQEVNSQIGVIAALLFDLARGADEQFLPDISQALIYLAQFTDDVNQRDSLLLISQQILNGGRGLFDLSAPFAVSPS